MTEKEPFWRVAANETEPCAHPDAAQIIDAYYDIPPDKRGDLDRALLDKLMHEHVIGEDCNACWRHLQQMKDKELEWLDPRDSYRSS